jgi:hypothetical protein
MNDVDIVLHIDTRRGVPVASLPTWANAVAGSARLAE